jgi:hypothetical protein
MLTLRVSRYGANISNARDISLIADDAIFMSSEDELPSAKSAVVDNI